MSEDVRQLAATVGLVDHHCHTVVDHDLDRAGIEPLLTESDDPGPSTFDAPVGVAVRALCAPLLGLERHCTAEAYLEARAALGAEEVTRRLLGATGIEEYVVETGVGNGPGFFTPQDVGRLGGGRVTTIARLEVVAEGVLAGAGSPQEAMDRLDAELDACAARDLGFKSVVAYRYGLDIDPDRPAGDDVLDALGRQLARRDDEGRVRVDDPVLLRHLLWSAVVRRRPLQLHVGYGDSDIVLHRCDPTQLTEFVRRTRGAGASLMLLHCYPFQREAAYLAQVYPHVHLDTGAATGFTGFGSAALVRESLELAPFDKILFSTDAYALPELYLCNAALWRRAVAQVFGDWVDRDEMGPADAARYLRGIASENAARVYAR